MHTGNINKIELSTPWFSIVYKNSLIVDSLIAEILTKNATQREFSVGSSSFFPSLLSLVLYLFMVSEWNLKRKHNQTCFLLCCYFEGKKKKIINKIGHSRLSFDGNLSPTLTIVRIFTVSLWIFYINNVVLWLKTFCRMRLFWWREKWAIFLLRWLRKCEHQQKSSNMLCVHSDRQSSEGKQRWKGLPLSRKT